MPQTNEICRHTVEGEHAWFLAEGRLMHAASHQEHAHVVSLLLMKLAKHGNVGRCRVSNDHQGMQTVRVDLLLLVPSVAAPQAAKATTWLDGTTVGHSCCKCGSVGVSQEQQWTWERDRSQV